MEPLGASWPGVFFGPNWAAALAAPVSVVHRYLAMWRFRPRFHGRCWLPLPGCEDGVGSDVGPGEGASDFPKDL